MNQVKTLKRESNYRSTQNPICTLVKKLLVIKITLIIQLLAWVYRHFTSPLYPAHNVSD